MRSLPSPRGPLSELLVSRLTDEPGPVHEVAASPIEDPLSDEDLQLALYLCYELHYRGLPGVSDDWEWEPSLLRLRARLESRFERALREAVAGPAPVSADTVDMALRAISELEASSLSAFIRTRA